MWIRECEYFTCKNTTFMRDCMHSYQLWQPSRWLLLPMNMPVSSSAAKYNTCNTSFDIKSCTYTQRDGYTCHHVRRHASAISFVALSENGAPQNPMALWLTHQCCSGSAGRHGEESRPITMARGLASSWAAHYHLSQEFQPLWLWLF